MFFPIVFCRSSLCRSCDVWLLWYFVFPYCFLSQLCRGCDVWAGYCGNMFFPIVFCRSSVDAVKVKALESIIPEKFAASPLLCVAMGRNRMAVVMEQGQNATT